MKKTLLVIATTALASIAILGIASYSSGSKVGTLVSAISFALLAVIWWLIWNNHLLIPRIIGPLAAFFAAFILCVTRNGIHDRSMFNFLMAFILAGLMLGRTGIVIFGGLILLTIGGMAYAEINGILVNEFSAYTTTEDAIIISVFFTLTFVIYYLAINNLTDSLMRLRRSEAVLSENNRELDAIRLGLEDQVTERTRNLETARQETEAANRALQAQMWQISGLAQLGDVMRGEQDLPTLSANVIQHLCRYADAAIGALYVRNDAILRQTGSYAYTLSPE
ncbi:MAG: hypothetical protein JXA21_04045, partial [Anaerolineae bacterium]|nr:hypothetical protein [Anaerolineae bacterium]